MNKTLSLIALVLTTAVTSFAGQTINSKKVVVPAEECRFRSNEWQVDVSVMGSAGLYGGNTNQAIGGNFGLNYFWSKYFGVGLDDSVGGTQTAGKAGSSAFDGLHADFFARYPICVWNLAPYAMVGGGAHWGAVSQGQGCVGGGLEYRCTSNVGLFADCRWLYGDNGSKSLSIALPRVGVRFAF